MERQKGTHADTYTFYQNATTIRQCEQAPPSLTHDAEDDQISYNTTTNDYPDVVSNNVA